MSHTKHTKLGEFKIVARITVDKIQIAYKAKNNIAFQVTDHGFKQIVGGGFTFYLQKEFTQVIYENDDKGRHYLELVQPAKDEKINLKPVDKDVFNYFLKTDYNGKEL